MKEKFNCFIVNIKLQSEIAGEERTKEYIRIIKELSSSKKILKIGKNEGIQMYSIYGVRDGEIPEYIYGHMAKGAYIEGDQVNVIEGGQIVKEENKPRVINPITSDFIFIPKKHRLIVEKLAGTPTEKQVEEYLNKFLVSYVRKDDILEIVLEKDENVIRQIYDAKSVYKLSYEISYTNDDAIGPLGDELEKQIKKSKIGKLKLTAEADNKSEGLDIDNSVLLEGGLELAEANGTINSAKIKPKGGTKIISISNKDKPKVIPIEIDTDLGSKFKQWYNKMIKLL